MELNDELKLLLIKTEAHKNEAAATGVFNTIRDLSLLIRLDSDFEPKLDGLATNIFDCIWFILCHISPF